MTVTLTTAAQDYLRVRRTLGYKLDGADEIYDLDRDPYELRNLINDPAAPKKKLQARLAAMLVT